MNPFTKFLTQWSRNRLLNSLVEQWDVVEMLVIRVYRGGQVSPADAEQYQQARTWLLEQLPKVEASLRPYWERSKVAGSLAHDNPFQFILQYSQAADFLDNWKVMQYLPAAREALNGYIVAVTGDES